MEDSISTSVSSARTVLLGYSPDLAGGSQSRRESRDHVPGMEASAATISNRDSEYTTYSTMSSGVIVSTPASPRMHALVLPSPPDSPGGSPSPSVDSASESSLPSVSSSFFFSSSAPGSPGRTHSYPGSYPSSHPQSDHELEHEHDQSQHHSRVREHGLIIPSLSLPDPLRRPTPFGKTLGDIRVLVLGAQGAGKSFLTGLLLEDNEDVVDVGTWEDWSADIDIYGKVLKASTDWLEQHNAFGMERFEPTRNIEIVELPGYSHDIDSSQLISRLKSVIEGPFHSLNDVLHPETDPSGLVTDLLASPSSPLYTALLFLLPSAPTPLDLEFIGALSSHIPLIVLPRLDGTSTHFVHIPSAKLSSFRPSSPVALRNGLFRSPETAALLRAEAVDRFLRWREVEKAVDTIWKGSQRGMLTAHTGRAGLHRSVKLGESDWGRDQIGQERISKKAKAWSKANWEAEWMEDYAQEVARRVQSSTCKVAGQGRSRAGTMLPPLKRVDTAIYAADPARTSALDTATDSTPVVKDSTPVQWQSSPSTCSGMTPSFDPLHLPSLFVFSVSLLGPLRLRVWASLKSVMETFGEAKVQAALLGGFCIGVGAGVWVRS